jgi:hypothetical protein
MTTVTTHDAFDRSIDALYRDMSPELAQQIANFRPDPVVAKRVKELFQKCNEGELTPAERDEYQAYVEANDVITILKLKAKKVLRASNAG